jgi:hypothetical protein
LVVNAGGVSIAIYCSTGSFPPVPELTSQQSEQATSKHENPGPEQKISGPVSGQDGHSDPYQHQAGDQPWTTSQVSQHCGHPPSSLMDARTPTGWYARRAVSMSII